MVRWARILGGGKDAPSKDASAFVARPGTLGISRSGSDSNAGCPSSPTGPTQNYELQLSIYSWPMCYYDATFPPLKFVHLIIFTVLVSNSNYVTKSTKYNSYYYYPWQRGRWSEPSEQFALKTNLTNCSSCTIVTASWTKKNEKQKTKNQTKEEQIHSRSSSGIHLVVTYDLQLQCEAFHVCTWC